MTNKLFCGSVSYQVNFSCYKPSINEEIINISQKNQQNDADSKIQESKLKVEILNDQSLEFILSLKTSFFESNLSVAKEWFTDYQEWIFTTFATQTGSIIEQHQKPTVSEINPPEFSSIDSFIGSESACFLQVYSSSPLSQKVGDWSFLGPSQFIETHPKIKTICKQYAFCLQCQDSIARYMFLYNLLFQINEYQGRSDRQADIDDLIREVIQAAKDREELIKNQETYKPDSPESKKKNRKQCETIYTCLRNEIAHKRTHRILVLDNKTDSPSKLTLEQTIYDIKQYVSSLSRIVQLAILNLSSQASLD
ncbi:hypothetical protein AMR42_01445 [Limnothrix sp. PR1529]|uniref:hypothetical protein n=1 Tax=Limnothrix sp. PR1529 TaxID=1704291 RepID=UPI00081F5B5F|nr:hypothetical protein [Limnothrix sp. PR1529]OCQ89138.1 hypothetical protein BCR12_00320 [Limnothrix sp. P13C2]PIB15207.1 hypothetical protein AMR42_01445 [Limnothrix sp. PR1529]